MNRLFGELRRRNVFRVAGVYAVVGWLLAQAAVLLETSIGLPVWFDGLLVALLLISFPVALILAWAFELTPEGVTLTAKAPEGASAASKAGRRLDYTILAGVALVVALFIADRLTPERTPPAEKTADRNDASDAAPSDGRKSGAVELAQIPAASIAVLPFADLSPAGDQAYFSDGVAEEILNVLARIDGLKVASRTSSFQFRGRKIGAPAIAKEIGVRHILEGSVRKAGSAIRITAQLIDAQTDAHLWSNTFDRPLTAENIFAIQDEIAKAIVEALREELDADLGAAAPAPVRTGDVGAYELYLKGRALFQSRRDLDEADHLLERAVGIDPDFADALAIRAAIYQFGGEYGADFGEAREARKIGRDFATRALAADASNSLALAVNALTDLYDHIEGVGSAPYDDIFSDLEKALAADPTNSNALNWLGIAYGFVGDNEKAVAAHRRCISVDPALAACRSNLALELASLGRLKEANAVVDSAVDFGAMAAGPGQMILLAALRRRDAFLFVSLNVPALRGWRKFGALYEALRDPRPDPALAAELKATLVANNASPRVFLLLNALGDYGKPPLIVANWFPAMEGYRRSLEFKRHARASGLPDYWRTHGFPPQCKPVGKDDFACE
jgi:TolB-like protein